MSTGETQLRPTAMLFRNLASMDVEESIRGNPIDGVVLLMGCDKTTPALMMGAASCNLPTIGLSGGPMLNGKFRGQDIGSGTGVWKMSEMVRAGEMTQEDFTAAESCMHRSKGNCMTMGTASTMASMVQALGMSLPENPAVLREISHLLHLDAPTVNGKTIGENIASAPCWNREVIRPLDKPLLADAGIAVLRGNLAPDGAVIKPSAASAHLLKHRGRAVV